MLFFFRDLSIFIPLYIFCGISDILDGYIARKYESVSTLGARMDSIADAFFYVILLIYFYRMHGELFSPYLYSILIVVIIKIFGLLAGFAKYRKLIMLHTLANKGAGFMVYLLPIGIWLDIPYCIPVVLTIAFLASAEELLIILKSPRKEINLNIKSVFRNN